MSGMSAQSSGTTGEGESSSASRVTSVKYQLSKLRELRLDVDKLRSLVTDKLAEDMGRRLTCNPQ